jgi:hypothetical protein
MKVAFLIVLLLSGCASRTDEARSRAASDLNCPYERIYSYTAAHGVVVARGCGAWTEYECFRTRSGAVCVREAPAQVNADLPPAPVVWDDEGNLHSVQVTRDESRQSPVQVTRNTDKGPPPGAD